MLILVATPIGNLADISSRALETLKTCDYILCEDTRHSLKLLFHYNIQKPLKSYHQFNEAAREEEVLRDLFDGKTIALISDAGTPGISDPGERLVQCCREKGIAVTSTPGPCAAIHAISCSGFSTSRFQFYGFLPRKSKELSTALQEILHYPGTTICYETPNRLKETLQAIDRLAPQRRVAISRELTKAFEEHLMGTASELISQWEEKRLLGEAVLLIEGQKQVEPDWNALTPEEHVALMEKDYGMERRDAIKAVAKLRGVPKRAIYNGLL